MIVEEILSRYWIDGIDHICEGLAKGVSRGRHLRECCLIENSKLKREEEEEASLAVQVKYMVGS